MKISFRKILSRTFKTIGIALSGIILIMFLVPVFFPQTVNRKIDQWANSNINGNITFTKSGLSFFKHFPSLTLTLYNVTLKGSAPFEQDTLIAAGEISLGVDLSSVFKSKVNVREIFLDDALFNIQVDSAGHANYNVYKTQAEKGTSANDTSGASLGINKIIIKNSRLVYNDRSLPMLITARGLYYSGSGDLSKDIFDLYTHTEIQSFDFSYNKQPYIVSKKINADLITEINTKSLAFIFRKNNLFINQLPVEFNGRFGFIKDGYDMDFNIDSHENNLSDIITALPASYQKMLSKTEVSGTGIIQVGLAGKFIAKDTVMPDLAINVKVRSGFINTAKSPAPLKNLYIDMSAKMPGMKTDSMSVNVDSLYFNLADGYFESVLKVKGFSEPHIYAKVNSEIDLENWNRAVGLKHFEVKGKYSLHLLAEGKFSRTVERHGLRKMDTVISSIPKFKLRSSFRDGYIKYASLPEAINNVSFDLVAECADSNYKHANLAVEHLNIEALDNYVRGYFKLGNVSDFPIDAQLQVKLHMDDIQKVYPADSMELKGDLDAQISAKGNYLPEKKQYPILSASVSMQNGWVKTKYYPDPVKDIQVATTITDSTGTLKGLNININPISFTFEDEPFILKAKLRDFTDLDYKVHLKGNLNIGDIYKVFARKGYNVTGVIGADLKLKGKESDIKAGNYDKLADKGSLTIEGVTCTTQLYPKPFVISKGVFSFNQDKMRLDTFTVQYGNSEFILNGAVSNVIAFLVKPGSVLTGNLNLSSPLIVVDDFMAYASSATQGQASAATAAPANGATGVVLVPGNLDLDLSTNVDVVKYNGMEIDNVQGHLQIQHDSLLLKEAGFDLIGAPVTMDASYAGINPQQAYFNYHITATDFDIHKAYTNIKLFHDIATSAAHAEGLVSLDYQLCGNLNGNMQPIYSSLKGGGVLSARKISMHGFKLFGAIGREAKQDSLDGNSDVSKVAIKTSIANNKITIERTRIRVSGFRARLEGLASFDNNISLKFRLGLPPLGLVGIPMTITGTAEKPNIEVGKGRDEDANEVDSTE